MTSEETKDAPDTVPVTAEHLAEAVEVYDRFVEQLDPYDPMDPRDVAIRLFAGVLAQRDRYMASIRGEIEKMRAALEAVGQDNARMYDQLQNAQAALQGAVHSQQALRASAKRRREAAFKPVWVCDTCRDQLNSEVLTLSTMVPQLCASCGEQTPAERCYYVRLSR